MATCFHSSVRTCDGCMQLYCIACDTPTFYIYIDLCKSCDFNYNNPKTVKCLGEDKLWYPNTEPENNINPKYIKKNIKERDENSKRVHTSYT